MKMPNEILLTLAEHMDTATRLCFMASNKKLYNLINSYEHSISESRAASFPLPPLGNILSSSTHERHVLRPYTFKIVRELELREHRIARLVKYWPQLVSCECPYGLPALTVSQQARLGSVIRRALNQCDRIADIAANEPCVLIPPRYYDYIFDEMYSLPEAMGSTDEELSKFNPLTRIDARLRQIEYIRSLSLEDIAGLFTLVNMIGYQSISSKTITPEKFASKVITEECILRHGTWFVWSDLLGDIDMIVLASYIVEAGKTELRGWEAGTFNAPPGLKMTLSKRFRELVGGETTVQVAINMDTAISKLLGDDE
ncbi:hypothetical protein SAMD00023353_0100760 [Rosellinia necatrix]|uniref:F-box domain-containing protein n=1 Tax=Rosellinia necatrix TaxID=77044 RepID=A0A1S7UHD0_ROSNE|nr:hypothetical protein SAMD00023353_0100760 [Rosellinia necatrix]